jgi:hypothetical protein
MSKTTIPTGGITDGTIATGDIADDAITTAKIGTLTQLAFNATQSASTNANTLDDYEEGTWTPTFSNYSGTDQNVVGYYTKVGNLVTAGCRIGTDGTSDSSVATIAGLPFTVRSGGDDGAIGGGLVTYTQGLAAQRWRAINNTATVKCVDGTGNDVNYNDFGANKDVMLIITYFV